MKQTQGTTVEVGCCALLALSHVDPRALQVAEKQALTTTAGAAGHGR